jgi:DNA-binding NtrC family response regulator
MKSRILLVEDDEFIGAFVRATLSTVGHEVVICERLSEVKELPDFNFAALLTDFQLPGGNGCDVIEFVRSKTPGLPAVLLSGYGGWALDHCTQRCIPGVLHLGKPFRADQLLHLIEALVPIDVCGERHGRLAE